MTLSNALLLIDPGVDWKNYLENDDDNGILGYTFRNSTNPLPNYYYINGNPLNGFNSQYAGFIIPGSEAVITSAQQSLIRYYLSDTTGVDYRISFTDVADIQFEEQNSPSAQGELFFSNANVNTAGSSTRATSVVPGALYDTWAGDVFFDNVQYHDGKEGPLEVQKLTEKTSEEKLSNHKKAHINYKAETLCKFYED